MIIKCRLCKKEFDTKRQKNEHERMAHPEGAVQYHLNAAKKKAAIQEKQ
jgi:hypothetical protein